MPKGRKDGRISKANDSLQILPSPTFNISQLQQSFSQIGLSLEDLVALSGKFTFIYIFFTIRNFPTLLAKIVGGHTLGFSHCSSFENRIRSFSNTIDVDPTMDRSFAATLTQVCPLNNKVKNAGAFLDSTPTQFDSAYFKLLVQGKSLFSSDQALLTSSITRPLVHKFAASKEEFFEAFVKSMIKMSSINGGGTEIRLDCRAVN